MDDRIRGALSDVKASRPTYSKQQSNKEEEEEEKEEKEEEEEEEKEENITINNLTERISYFRTKISMKLIGVDNYIR
jgi:CO dehydrogenase/acetyl-CoA synthase beta subunit